MAIRKIEGKSGTSYKITISAGRTLDRSKYVTMKRMCPPPE